MSELAQLIRRRRLELGLTQRAAAQRASISLATWQNLERPNANNGSYQDLTLARAANGLQLDLQLLFHTAGRPLPDPESFPNDRPEDTEEPDSPTDVDQLITELDQTLRELAHRSIGSFLIVHGQAAEAALHLLELHNNQTETDPPEH